MLKTKKSFVLLAFILTSLLITKSTYANTAIINGDNLNVRNGPGTEFERIYQVHRDETYKVIEETDGWVKIKLENQSGWIVTDYITIEKSNDKDMKESMLDEIEIVHNQTQIRNGNGTDYEIIAFADKGEVFQVVSESNNWLEISNDDLTGYIWKELILAEQPSYTSPGFHNKTIIIDPGHGGRDVGAVGVSKTYERDVVDFTARILKRELERLGANVLSTRLKNEFIPLKSRTAFANTVAADAFLSIHYNSFPEVPSVTGIETFYHHPQHELIATQIHEGIIDATNEDDRDVSVGDPHVIRQTFIPNALLELGFISNEKSVSKLETVDYQEEIVSGIIDGLQKYFARGE